MIRGVILGGSVGGAPRARTIEATVPRTAGLLTTVSTLGLLPPVAFAKTGGNANLSIGASTGAISAAAALAAGASQTLTGTATGADGCVLPFTATLTGAAATQPPADSTPPTITSASAHSVNENAGYSATATASEAVTWARGGADAGVVTLNGSTGAWSVAGQDYDFGRQVVTFTLTATDLAGNTSAPQTVTLSIVNVNDTNPTAFSFAAANGVALGSTQTSPTITIGGLGASDSVAVAVSGAASSLLSKNNGAFVMGPVTAVNGDTLAVRHTASTSNATSVSTTLAAGTTTASFTSTTLVAGALSPVGSTFGLVGDGIMSAAGGAGAGSRNMVDWFELLMGARVQPVPFHNLSQSGTVMTQPLNSNSNIWINPTAVDALIAQKPDIAIFGCMGHNDGLKSTDPDTNPIVFNDWKNALSRHVAGHASAQLIPVMSVWPSAVAGETAASSFNGSISVRQRVRDLQKAYVESFNDARLVWIDVSTLDPQVVGDPTDVQRIHPDADGGQQGGAAMFNAISPRVAAATPAQIQSMIDAGTYPLMGTQLDSDRGLAGTGGTATTGMQSGSTIATSKMVSSTVPGAAVSSSMVSTGGYNKIVVTFSGTATASGNVLVQDKAAAALGATPGQYVVSGFGVRIPTGLNRIGSSLGTFGAGMSGIVSSDDMVSDQPLSTSLDTIMLTNALPINGTAAPTAMRNLYLRWKNGATLSGQLEMYQWFSWIVRDRTRHAPVYLGDLKPAGSGATLAGANYRLRPTGAVSAASGGTVRIDPGRWAPFGLTEADFSTRRLYKGTSANTGIGTGSLLATISGATWTYAVPAGAVAAGDLIYAEVDTSNGIGGIVTARSVTTITAT